MPCDKWHQVKYIIVSNLLQLNAIIKFNYFIKNNKMSGPNIACIT